MNDFLLLLQSKLDEASFNGVKGNLDQLKKDFEELKIKPVIDQQALSNIVRQLESITGKKIVIPNIEFNTEQAVKDAKKMAQQIVNASNSSTFTVVQNERKKQQAIQETEKEYQKIAKDKSLVRDDSVFKRIFGTASNEAKNAQKHFKELLENEKAVVTVNEKFDNNNALQSFVINIKRANGEVESLRYAMEDLERYTGKANDWHLTYQGGTVNDANAIRQFEQMAKAITDYQIKFNDFKIKYSKTDIDTSGFENIFNDFKNGIGTVNSLKLAFNQLENAAKMGVQNLKSQSASLDQITQAVNNMRDMPTMLKNLETNMLGVNDKTVLADISIDQLTSRYMKLKNEMDEAGGKVPLNGNWAKEYQKLMSDVVSAIKRVTAEQVNAEKSTSSFFASFKKSFSFLSHLASANYIFTTVIRNIKQAVSDIHDLDDALTSISYTMDVSNKQLEEIKENALQMAKTLHTSASKVMEAVKTYANANETAESILEKSKIAIMMSNTTGMDTRQTTDILQGVMEQFELEEDKLMHISDVMQKVSMSMPYDFAQGVKEISEGIKASGSVAKDAGYDIENYTALLGTLIAKTRQSGGELARSLRTMMVRTTKASTSALASGEVTENDLSNAEKALRRVGIEVRSDLETFKDFDEIMGELYQKINSLSDVDLSNIAYEVASTRQTNVFKMMIKAYGDYKDMVEQTHNADNTTLINQQKYTESLTGKMDEMSAIWEKIDNDMVDSSFLKGLADAGIAVSLLIEKVGLLKTAFASVGAATFIKNYNNLKKTGETLNILKVINNVSDTKKMADGLKRYSTESVKAAIAQSTLDEAQIRSALSAKMLEGQALETATAELAQTTATNGLVVSEGAATTATVGFGNAVKGLGASIKAFALSYPILTAIAAVGVTVYGAVKIYDALTISVEEASEALQEAIGEYESVKSELESISSELKTQGERIDELNAKDHLTYAEKEELERLQEITKELTIQQKLKEKELESAAKQVADDTVDAYKKQFGKYELSDTRMKNEKDYIDYSGVITDFKAPDLAGQIAVYEELIKRKDEAYEKDNEAYSENKRNAEAVESIIWEQIGALEEYKEALSSIPYEKLTDEQKTVLDEISNKIEYTWKRLDPDEWTHIQLDNLFSKDGMEEVKNDLIKLSNAGELSNKTIVSNEKFHQILKDTGLGTKELISYIQSLENELETLTKAENNPPIPSISDIISNLDDIESNLNSVNELYKEFKDNNQEGFSNEKLSSFIETFKEIEGVNVNDFLNTLTDSSSTAEQVQQAFNDLASEYLNHTKILDTVNENNKDYIANKLQEIGITNSLALVEAQLTLQRNRAKLETLAMSNATYGEFAALRDEIAATDEAKFAINQYYLEKITANGISLSTSGDIENIMSLVKACGGGIAALKAFHEAKQGLQSAFNNTLSQNNWKASTAIGQAEARKNFESQLAEYKENEENLIAKAESEINAVLNKKYDAGSNYGGNKSNGSGGGSGSGSGSKAKKDAAEVYDWIETLIKRTDEKIDELQKKATDAKGWRTKNELQDTVFDELQTKLEQSKSAYERYMQEANSVGLSDIYVNKIQNGEIDIEEVKDDNLKEMIKDYQKWYENAKECEKAIEEINDEAKKTREIKLDNIIKDYDQLVSLMKAYTDYRKDLVSVRDRMGERLYQDDYQELIDDQQEIYDILAEKYEELNNELNSGGIEQGTEKWYEMKEELIGIKSEMINCANAVEDFKDQIFELRFKPLEDLVSKLDSVNSELSNMVSLIGDDGLVKDGMLTDRGLTTVAMYSRQIVNAKKEAEEYKAAIKALNASYRNGDITLDEYNEKLYEYRSAQQEAALATKEARDAIIALREEAINQEIDAMEELIQAKIDLLDEEKELYEYQKKIAGDNRNIAMLERQIQVLSLSTDRADIAQRLQLEAELAKAREDLAEYQREHSVESQKDALQKEGDAYKEAKEKELEDLRTNLEAQEELIKKYLGQVTNHYTAVYDTLTIYADEYNMVVTEDLTSPFSSAEMATQSFQNVFSDAISSIQYQINSIDWSNMTRGLDELGDGFGGDGDYENISSQGKWQKGKGGKWWFGEDYREDGDYWYASDGYYNINGKTYGFDEDGYMKTEWDDSQGDWHYFDKDTGEMQKSQWIQGKGGEWYYLTADGSMARDAAVKAKDGNGYYLVDEDGAWRKSDGILTKKQVDELGYDIAYKKGTKHAQKGVALTDEEELGSEVLITKDGALRQLDYGDRVFNSNQVETLWKLSQMSDQLLSDAPWNQNQNQNQSLIDPSILRSIEPSIHISNSVTVQGDASERTVGLIQDAINDFAKNRMGGELMKQIRRQIKR